MTRAAAAIRARGLSAGYGRRTVLRSVSFDVARNRTCVVVGPGGSGKSTLLRVLSGAGGEAAPWTRGRFVLPQRPSGYLAQHGLPPGHGLSSLLSVDVSTARAIVAAFWCDVPEAVDALAPVLGEPLERLPGWLRRLAEFTAVASNPVACLLLDEPDARIGPGLEWLGRKLRQIRRRQTALVVTHHLAFARLIADQVLLLVDGALVEAADAESFFERPSHPRTRDFVRQGC